MISLPGVCSRYGVATASKKGSRAYLRGADCGVEVVWLRTIHDTYGSQSRISTSTWMGWPPVHTSDSGNPAGCMAPEQTTSSIRVGDSSTFVVNASARPPSPHCRPSTVAAIPSAWRYSRTILCGFCAMTGLSNRSTSLWVSGGVDPRKGDRFLHDFTQTLMPHLCAASHDARNSSGGTYFSAECNLFRL